jgi:HK97 family phage major capsid protein
MLDAKQLETLIENQTKTLQAIESYQQATNKQFATMNEKIVDLEKTRSDLEKSIAQLDGIVKSRAESVLPGLGDEIQKNGAVNPFLVCFDKGSRDHALTKEYTQKKRDIIRNLDGMSARDMTASNDVNAGYLVPTISLPGYIDKARANAPVWHGAGLTIYDNLVGGIVEIPIVTGDVTVEDVAENAAATASDLDIGMVTWSPKMMKSLVKLSDRLLRNSKLAEAVIRDSMIKVFALTMDLRILRGTGTNKQALGIANTPGITNVELGTDGARMTLEAAADMRIAVEVNNLLGGSLKYIGHPWFFEMMKRQRIAQFSGDTGGEYLALPTISDAMLASLIGYDMLKTSNLPMNLTKGTGTALTEGYFGNWAEGYLGIWEDLTFKSSNQAGTSFENSQTWIQAELEYDFQVPRPLAFAYVNDAKTT